MYPRSVSMTWLRNSTPRPNLVATLFGCRLRVKLDFRLIMSGILDLNYLVGYDLTWVIVWFQWHLSYQDCGTWSCRRPQKPHTPQHIDTAEMTSCGHVITSHLSDTLIMAIFLRRVDIDLTKDSDSSPKSIKVEGYIPNGRELKLCPHCPKVGSEIGPFTSLRKWNAPPVCPFPVSPDNPEPYIMEKLGDQNKYLFSQGRFCSWTSSVRKAQDTCVRASLLTQL